MNDIPFLKSEALKIKTMAVEQPIGKFYVGVANAIDVIEICTAKVRKKSDRDMLERYTGIQRTLNEKRVNDSKLFLIVSSILYAKTSIKKLNINIKSVGPIENFSFKPLLALMPRSVLLNTTLKNNNCCPIIKTTDRKSAAAELNNMVTGIIIIMGNREKIHQSVSFNWKPKNPISFSPYYLMQY